MKVIGRDGDVIHSARVVQEAVVPVLTDRAGHYGDDRVPACPGAGGPGRRQCQAGRVHVGGVKSNLGELTELSIGKRFFSLTYFLVSTFQFPRTF